MFFIDAFGTNCFANDRASALGAGRKVGLGPRDAPAPREKLDLLLFIFM